MGGLVKPERRHQDSSPFNWASHVLKRKQLDHVELRTRGRHHQCGHAVGAASRRRIDPDRSELKQPDSGTAGQDEK